MKTKIQRPRVTKPEIAEMIALQRMGQSNKSISRLTGRHHQTTRYFCNSPIHLGDPEVKSLVEVILAHEHADLAIIGDKARSHLHSLLDGGGMRAIETIAAMDRSFQQRRLLEGLSTENVGIIAKVRQIDDEIAGLEAELAAVYAGTDGEGKRRKRQKKSGARGIGKSVLNNVENTPPPTLLTWD